MFDVEKKKKPQPQLETAEEDMHTYRNVTTFKTLLIVFYLNNDIYISGID